MKRKNHFTFSVEVEKKGISSVPHEKDLLRNGNKQTSVLLPVKKITVIKETQNKVEL